MWVRNHSETSGAFPTQPSGGTVVPTGRILPTSADGADSVAQKRRWWNGSLSLDRFGNVVPAPAFVIVSHAPSDGTREAGLDSLSEAYRAPGTGPDTRAPNDVPPRGVTGIPARSQQGEHGVMNPNRRPTAPPSAPELPLREAGGRRFALVLLTTGIIGWAASAQLVLERLALYADPDYVTTCDVSPFISCGQVFRTSQASAFGFPNPLIGIVAFAVVITTAVALLAGARFARWYWLGLQSGVTLGMAFVGWLWFQALFTIHILCLYCMVVWAMMIILFVATTAHSLRTGTLPAGRRVQRFAAEWSWVVALLLVLATAASVLVTFAAAFFPA